MDILLFNQFYTSSGKNPDIPIATLPLNLLYLASFLKSRGMPSKIFELGPHRKDSPTPIYNRLRYGMADDTIINILKKEDPKVVGIGCMYSRHYIDVLSLVRLIKKFNPAIRTVLGGNHVTSFASLALKEKSIDFVVLGEGEITFYELCEAILKGKEKFEHIAGLAFRNKDGTIITAPKRELIQNLDDLPLLDYSLIDMEAYLDDTRVSPFLMRSPSFSVLSSRGCPGKCIFCTVKNVWGRTWRGRSPRHFVDEIELLHKKYKIREFAIVDDSASINKKRWEAICDEIINRKLDIKWTTPNGIAHWTLSKPVLSKMKKAGCYRITFGIESGNIQTRNFIGKPYSLEEAAQLIQYANRIGMWTISTNIIGFPYETEASINDTVRFAKLSGVDFATFYLLSPHVTSDVYSYFSKEGLLNYDSIFSSDFLDEDAYEKMEYALSEGGVDTKFLTGKQLKAIQKKAYRDFIIFRGLSFLVTPRLLYKIRNYEDLRCAIRYVLAGIRIFLNSFYKKNTHALLYD